LLPAVLAGILLVAFGCGPEAEMGGMLTRNGLAPGRSSSMEIGADTIDPKRQKSADIDAKTDISAESGVPAGSAAAVSTDYLMGKFNPARHPDFVPVGQPYTNKTGMILHRETFSAFKKMWAAAKKEGVTLIIISSTRSFEQQKSIWEGKWSRFAAEQPEKETRARKILEYSAMPGASRHHWGSDIDLNDLNNPSFETGGRFNNVYDWLRKHAHEYGFCQPYTAKNDRRPNGYNEEKWHWSYLPVAAPLLRQYNQSVRDDMFKGFSGAETAKQLHIVDHYVLGINQDCKSN